jgi:hypothetical protein
MSQVITPRELMLFFQKFLLLLAFCISLSNSDHDENSDTLPGAMSVFTCCDYHEII